MTGIGYNVSLSYSSNALREWVESYIASAKPAAMLMFDTHGHEQAYVAQLAARFPSTTFEYRLWIPDPGNPNNGDNQQLYLSADEWVAKHAKLAGSRVYCTINNEPNHSDLKRTCDWHIAVMREAKKRNIKCAVGGYAFGHPLNHLDYSVYDEMVRVMHETGSIMDLHEYGRGPTQLADVPGNFDYNRPETWPTNVPLENAWLIGRVGWWFKHLDAKGIPRFRFIVGEAGWPTRPDRPQEHFRNVMASWPVSDKEKFLADQIKWTHKVAWNIYGSQFLGACLFTLNDGGRWDFSNYLHVSRARALMSTGFERSITVPSTQFNPYQEGYWRLKRDLTLRGGPDTTRSAIRVISAGNIIKVLNTSLTTTSQNIYGWQMVSHAGDTGYMALHGWSNPSLEPALPDERRTKEAVCRDMAQEIERHNKVIDDLIKELIDMP